MPPASTIMIAISASGPSDKRAALPRRARMSKRHLPGTSREGSRFPRCDHAILTAPIGPSKGIPETISAADAVFMASTSCGFTRSAPKTVPTTWTSLRNPFGKDGRSGRSISLSVRMA